MNNKVIVIGLFLIAVAAIVVVGGFFEQMRTSAVSSPSTVVNCGDPNVRCVFDAGDSWTGVFGSPTNETTGQLKVKGPNPEESLLTVDTYSFRIGRTPRLIIATGDILISGILPVQVNASSLDYYLCLKNNGSVVKSTVPCR